MWDNGHFVSLLLLICRVLSASEIVHDLFHVISSVKYQEHSHLKTRDLVDQGFFPCHLSFFDCKEQKAGPYMPPLGKRGIYWNDTYT